MTLPRRLLLPLLMLLLGGVSTALVLAAGVRGASPFVMLAGAVFVIFTTLGNISLRWLRWHLLLRGLGVKIPARHAALFFTAALPLSATPWALGEFVQVALLRLYTPHPYLLVGSVWLISRAADALALLCLAYVFKGWMLLLAPLVLVGATLILGLKDNRFTRLGLFIGLSLAAWVLPVLGLQVMAALLNGQAAWHAAAEAFARGTLLAGAVGAPGGVAVAGSVMISTLQTHGLAYDVAAMAVAVSRWGTTWFACGLGLLTSFIFRRRLLKLLRRGGAAQAHFEELSDHYVTEIPEHVRTALLARKLNVIEGCLRRYGMGPAARGLDIGCGQGWYAAGLALRGYKLAGVDPTEGQIRGAEQHAQQSGVQIDFKVAGVDGLPFADGSLDFAYAINVLHHVIDPITRAKGLAEIVRVLRPGGVFLLLEMNTLNPFFRLYMSYIFPLLREIDDGTEVWIKPTELPQVAGAKWQPQVQYYTFLPDFIPPRLQRMLAPLECMLEHSPLRHWSAHYTAILQKDKA